MCTGGSVGKLDVGVFGDCFGKALFVKVQVRTGIQEFGSSVQTLRDGTPKFKCYHIHHQHNLFAFYQSELAQKPMDIELVQIKYKIIDKMSYKTIIQYNKYTRIEQVRTSYNIRYKIN